MRLQIVSIFALLLVLCVMPFAVSSQGVVTVKRIGTGGTPTPTPTPTPFAFVQSKNGSGTVTPNSNFTTGNKILVGVFPRGSAAPTVTAISDGLGNTYTAVGTIVNAFGLNEGCQIWYAENITGGAAALSYTLGGSATNVYSHIFEFSGGLATGALGTHNEGSGTGTPTLNVTSTQVGDLLFGANVDNSGVTAGSGFTFNGSSANWFESTEYKASGSSGTVAIDFTGSTFWELSVVRLKVQ